MLPVNTSKPFLPSIEEYMDVLRRVWETQQLTNNGSLLQELEEELSRYLGVEHLVMCANGTIALQLALEVLPLRKECEIITTPFSYVATLDSIVWQKFKPVFADIEKDTWCIDPAEIEKKITKNTGAILATHIFGRPCDIEAIQEIASRHSLPVIYDGAHSFGCSYRGRSLLSYGDLSTCSFNATKIFHTVEGGCVICKDAETAGKLRAMRYFGISGSTIEMAGTNGKQSEFHAAMGLANIKHMPAIRARYRELFMRYQEALDGSHLVLPSKEDEAYNFAYFPVVFPSERSLLEAQQRMNEEDIFPKRYFYPSLNTLDFIEYQPCPIAEEISRRVLCLPLYYDLAEADVYRICDLACSTMAVKVKS